MKKLLIAIFLTLPAAASAADCGFPKDLMRGASNITDCGQYLRSLYINSKDLGDFAGLEKGRSGRVFLAGGSQVGAMLGFTKSWLHRPSTVVPGVMESIDAYDYAFLLAGDRAAFDSCDYPMAQDRLACVPGEYPSVSFTAKGRVERGNELAIKYSPLAATVRQYEGFYIMEGRLDGQLFYGYFWN
ncbi:MAG TPA: hypothetical protein DCZ92_15565 [Elusimicrobia bacterium]|nr:MAG: hypothetical protein A2016_12035 [Elusimicrobia bacterium GWF2_62_30]HBA62198.1 hypothetical protein [Elusimicrobiota bacterium]